MRILWLWARTSPALYLAPLGVGFLFYLTSDPGTFNPRSLTEALTSSLDVAFYTAGVAAACAAWDFGRLRRGSMRTLLPVRRQATVVALTLLPSLALAFVLHGVLSAVIIARLDGVGGDLPWPVIGSIALLLIAWTLAGAALGSALPPMVATPLTAGLAFIALAYAAASSNPVWRNITGGALVACCDVDEVARSEVWWATLLPLAGIFGAALLLLVRHLTLGHAVAAVAVVAAAFGFAMPYGTAVGWEPTEARDQSAQECQAARAGLEVCLWPEYESMRAELTGYAAEVDAAFEEFGVERPATVVQSGQIETGQWTFRAAPSFSERDYRHSIAYGLRADNYESCQFRAETEYGPLLADDVRLVMSDWLDNAVLADQGPGSTDGTAFEPFMADLYARAPVEQGAWFNALNQALRNCDADAATAAFATGPSPQ